MDLWFGMFGGFRVEGLGGLEFKVYVCLGGFVVWDLKDFGV